MFHRDNPFPLGEAKDNQVKTFAPDVPRWQKAQRQDIRPPCKNGHVEYSTIRRQSLYRQFGRTARDYIILNTNNKPPPQ